MQCVILVGGLGTRMQHLTEGKPKMLLPVGPRTFIDWQLSWLKRLGVDRVLLAVAHEAESIEEHVEKLKKERDFPAVEYERDGKELLGTGGAVRNAAARLEDDFLVTYGDSFLLIEPTKLMAAHKAAGRGLSMSIYENHDVGDKSNVLYEGDELKKYDKFHPTDEMRHIDYGMIALNKKYFLKASPQGKFDLAEVMMQATTKGQCTPFVVHQQFYEVGSPEGYQAYCDLMIRFNHDLARLQNETFKTS
jgi:NDP-sugar pyrophosphorylase family protein